jgi:hypothetical protein
VSTDESALDLDTSSHRIDRLLSIDSAGRLRGKCPDSADNDALRGAEICLSLDELELGTMAFRLADEPAQIEHVASLAIRMREDDPLDRPSLDLTHQRHELRSPE